MEKMKKMKKMTSKIFVVLLILLSISCEKAILEIVPQDRLAESVVWTDASLIKAYHTELYNAVPHSFAAMGTGKLTDEYYNSVPCCGADLFKLNTYNPDNIGALGSNLNDFWARQNNYLYIWNLSYVYLRKINVFLEKMQETEVSLPEKDVLVAEAKFLRAYVYFNLIERFGGVPIVDQVYNLGDEETFTRNTFEECVAFIEQNISEAQADLPTNYPSTSANFGRATGDAAQALLSRTYLYAASPLFNPSNDLAKWQKAADAAEDLLTSGYSLYPDYQGLFLTSQGDAQNEIIFSHGFTTANGHIMPADQLNRRWNGYGGWWGSAGPSGNLVDDYEMLNGEAPFLENGDVNPASGYDPQNPFVDRDPRFDASIMHDGSTFRGALIESWIAEDGSTWGSDSYKTTGDNPRPGTILKKFMPEVGPVDRGTQQTNQYIFFRLAEIYLNYAEAKFELGDEPTAREYLNKVRSREGVNMPDIPVTVTGEDLRKRIYNERRIELVFEDHRFYDVRRWKIATTTENAKITAIDVFKNLTTGVKRYEVVTLLDKTGTFQEYKSLFPIATDEILRTGLSQTPGWPQ
jgi:hypothetical protein